MKKLECCNTMIVAQEPGSGNNGYGKAVKVTWFNGQQLTIGIMSEKVKFCPWCGKEIKYVQN